MCGRSGTPSGFIAGGPASLPRVGRETAEVPTLLSAPLPAPVASRADYAIESFAAPAYEEIASRFASKEEIPQALKPRGTPKF